MIEDRNYCFKLDKKKQYYAELMMQSDSTNIVSRVDKQTIKSNGYKVFHGIIKSKNKVPIKIIE